MDSRLIFELIAILVLVLANGFFALSEFSIIASRKSRLRENVDAGKFGAEKAARLKAKPEQFLATVQVGITLIGAMLGVFSGATMVEKVEQLCHLSGIPLLQNVASPVAMVMVVLVITVLSSVIGELVPKYIAISFPERYARYVALPLTFFLKLTSFLARILAYIATLVVRMLGIKMDDPANTVSEDEINLMIVEGKEKGVFDETEQSFVRSVFEFSDSTVRRAMKPRADVVAFEKNISPTAVVGEIKTHGYSRYPVYDQTIDRVVGVLYAKDLIGTNVESGEFALEQVLREPLFVPDSMPLPTLLKEFKKGKYHMAVVLDEFGGTFGIITLEDILEELVGEIQDEYDNEAAPLVRHSDSVVYAAGNVWPGDVNELINTDLPEDEAETLAGLFIDTIGRFPEKHEAVQIADVRMTVLAMKKNRILRLKLEKKPVEEKS